MADIFLSYSSADRERVQPLVEVFQAAGWSVWWDRNIRLGESYDDAIDAAVKDARCIVTVWTESSVASRWVKNESMVGLERGVFVPVMLDPVELPIAFKTAQAADLTQWDGQPEGLANVVPAIEYMLHGDGPPPVHVGTSPHIQRKPWRTLAMVMAGAVAVVVIAWNTLDRFSVPIDEDPRPYLLVLPFDVSGGDTAQWQPFADQVTREIIRNLRKISGLRVVPPPSAFTFKGNKLRPHIRSQLPGVRYVLDGFISVAGSSGIRITPTLEDLSDESVVWDHDYHTRIDDTNFFTVQAEIAASVSKSLKVAILDGEKRKIDELPTENLAAYALYVNGRQQQDLLTHHALRRAIELFDEAIANDPDFAAAYIAKADAYRMLMTYFEKPIDMLANTSAAVFDAIILEPESAEARSSLGLAYVFAWRWRDAWNVLSDARSRDPDLALTELGFALYYTGLGDVEGVRRSLAKANRLDPLNSELADWGNFAFAMVGDLDSAIEWSEEKMRLHPDIGIVFTGASTTASLTGQHDRAIALAEKGARLDSRTPFSLIFLAQAYGRSGQTDKIRPLLAEAAESSDYMCPYETATAYLLLGEVDHAFELMDDAVAFRSNCLIFTRYDPRLEPMRGDPRFTTLLAKVGLDDESVKAYPR